MTRRLILGVESSCDETAAAVVGDDLVVRSNVVASQDALHAPYGGVVPEIASRSHLGRVIPIIEGALDRAEIGAADLAGVAVTRGPGLVGALLVGLQAAKAVAFAHHLPLVGVNHLEAHLMAVLLVDGEVDRPRSRPAFPFVGLLVSGGHTAIYLVRDWGDLKLIGETRDDAAGEAIDKFARMAGLGYPGGPIVDTLSAAGNRAAWAFPRALPRAPTEFSFSGLKTAVRTHIEHHGIPEGDAALADLCASVQEALVDVLVDKALHACASLTVPRLVICGGVAANSRLRALASERGEAVGVEVHQPPRPLCTDNAAMIAGVGAMALAQGQAPSPGAGLDLNAAATLPIG